MIKNDFPLTNKNYYEDAFYKRLIVIGDTYSMDMGHYNSWMNRLNGNYKKTANFTINRDGTIQQHFSSDYYSDFLDNDYDKNLISIVLENEGFLNEIGGDLFDWLGNMFENYDIVKFIKWRNKQYWVEYTDKQMESLVFLCKKLLKDYNIPNNVMDFNTKEDMSFFSGIAYRSNFNIQYLDINPTFNIEKFSELIKKTY